MAMPLMLQYNGEGEFRTPTRYWAREADKRFVVGEHYRLAEHNDRSTAAHNHYFAAVNEAWESLPDDLLTEYPSPEHLRKKMLVKAGYADERSIVCASKAEAQRVAAFTKPMDDYAVVVVREAVVRVYTAQSQSYKAMGKQVFSESKEKVLEAISALLGTERSAA
jgi:hypothetical protein